MKCSKKLRKVTGGKAEKEKKPEKPEPKSEKPEEKDVKDDLQNKEELGDKPVNPYLPKTTEDPPWLEKEPKAKKAATKKYTRSGFKIHG